AGGDLTGLQGPTDEGRPAPVTLGAVSELPAVVASPAADLAAARHATAVRPGRRDVRPAVPGHRGGLPAVGDGPVTDLSEVVASPARQRAGAGRGAGVPSPDVDGAPVGARDLDGGEAAGGGAVA